MHSGKKICALIGDPVDHSLSPWMHNAAFRRLELNYVYVSFKVKRKELGAAIQGVRNLKIHGLNVTMPLKVDVIKYLDQLDENAKKVGAVNTVQNNNGTLIGYNTDGKGALTALKTKKVELTNKKILILGAGGASRALSYSLAREAREVVVLNRTRKRGKNLVKDLSETFRDKIRFKKFVRNSLEVEMKDTDILINATPIGMRPNNDKTPVKQGLLRQDLSVFDLVYDPPETRLIREAKFVGATTIDGLSMLVFQGMASFEIWTNEKAPFDVMMKTALQNLE